MKKTLFAAIILGYCLLTAISSRAQQGLVVPDAVKESFSNNFKNSEYERWVKVKGSYVATFKVNETWRDAYFTEDGEYKGIGSHITTPLLPVFVQKNLADDFVGFQISELYQYESIEEGLSFYAVLKDDKHQLVVQFNPGGDVTFTRKSKLKEIKPVGSDVALDHAR